MHGVVLDKNLAGCGKRLRVVARPGLIVDHERRPMWEQEEEILLDGVHHGLVHEHPGNGIESVSRCDNNRGGLLVGREFVGQEIAQPGHLLGPIAEVEWLKHLGDKRGDRFEGRIFPEMGHPHALARHHNDRGAPIQPMDSHIIDIAAESSDQCRTQNAGVS